MHKQQLLRGIWARFLLQELVQLKQHFLHHLHCRCLMSCSGPLPDSFIKLKKLQWLMLEHNQLTGPLPTYLGQLPQLQRVLVQQNQLSGPVSISLCSGSAIYDCSNNVGLCGKCLLQAAISNPVSAYETVCIIASSSCIPQKLKQQYAAYDNNDSNHFQGSIPGRKRSTPVPGNQ
jgi:Leucine-rich repeat (LRR) protein